jgi:hypothetical protein
MTTPTTSARSIVRSAHKMMCFSCNRSIEIGEEITQCIETKGMNLRKAPSTGGRWVHYLCAPIGINTQFQIEMWNDMREDFPDTSPEYLWESLINHDYWIHQENDSPINYNFNIKLKKEVSELADKLVNSLQWFKIYADDEQMKRIQDAIYTDKHLDIEKKEFERITDETIYNLRKTSDCFLASRL